MTTSRIFSTYLHACGVGAVYPAGPVSEMQTESERLDKFIDPLQDIARQDLAEEKSKGNSFMTWHHAVVGGIYG